MAETVVDSFVLRFVREVSPQETSETGHWRGVIRHVQSNKEQRFTRLEEALLFVRLHLEETDHAEGEDGRAESSA
jgi:hypothetical protein